MAISRESAGNDRAAIRRAAQVSPFDAREAISEAKLL
jgi:hypothetical protein